MNRGSIPHFTIIVIPTRSFNEAPIHESGKYGLASRHDLGRPPASMRPRFMNRGSTGLPVRRVNPCALQ